MKNIKKILVLTFLLLIVTSCSNNNKNTNNENNLEGLNTQLNQDNNDMYIDLNEVNKDLSQENTDKSIIEEDFVEENIEAEDEFSQNLVEDLIENELFVFTKKDYENYIYGNISKLTNLEPVLGWKFYVTKLDWSSDNQAIVSIEDGHISNDIIVDISSLDNADVKNYLKTLENNTQNDADIVTEINHDNTNDIVSINNDFDPNLLVLNENVDLKEVDCSNLWDFLNEKSNFYYWNTCKKINDHIITLNFLDYQKWYYEYSNLLLDTKNNKYWEYILQSWENLLADDVSLKNTELKDTIFWYEKEIINLFINNFWLNETE